MFAERQRLITYHRRRPFVDNTIIVVPAVQMISIMNVVKHGNIKCILFTLCLILPWKREVSVFGTIILNT